MIIERKMNDNLIKSLILKNLSIIGDVLNSFLI